MRRTSWAPSAWTDDGWALVGESTTEATCHSGWRLKDDGHKRAYRHIHADCAALDKTIDRGDNRWLIGKCT